jgi:hypothetical protein
MDAPAPIPIIDPHHIFTLDSLTRTLSLRPGTLPRELRMGRLKYSKRAGRVWILGSWVLAWLQAGEIRRKRAGVEANGAMNN